MTFEMLWKFLVSAVVISSFLVALVVVDVRGLDLEVSLGLVSPGLASPELAFPIIILPMGNKALRFPLSLHMTKAIITKVTTINNVDTTKTMAIMATGIFNGYSFNFSYPFVQIFIVKRRQCW